MARYRVTCIHKRGSHFDPHERIAYIGSDGGKWKLSEDEAIRAIENYTSSFYTLVNSREAEVMVATHNGRKYLKTTADGYRPDNLLSLPALHALHIDRPLPSCAYDLRQSKGIVGIRFIDLHRQCFRRSLKIAISLTTFAKASSVRPTGTSHGIIPSLAWRPLAVARIT